MAEDVARPDSDRGRGAPRGVPALLAPIALAAIAAAATTEIAIHHEVWPWVASTIAATAA